MHGPGAYTTAVDAAHAQLQPMLLEGWMTNGIAAGGQLTNTTDVESMYSFPHYVTRVSCTWLLHAVVLPTVLEICRPPMHEINVTGRQSYFDHTKSVT